MKKATEQLQEQARLAETSGPQEVRVVRPALTDIVLLGSTQAIGYPRWEEKSGWIEKGNKMSMQATLGASAAKMKERLLSQGIQSEIKIISHSNIFYWWPAWTVGFATALFSYMQGVSIDIEPGVVDRIHASNNPGVFFILSSFCSWCSRPPNFEASIPRSRS